MLPFFTTESTERRVGVGATKGRGDSGDLQVAAAPSRCHKMKGRKAARTALNRAARSKAKKSLRGEW